MCGLHFLGGRKTYDVRLPSIFPWTPEWSDVVNGYNSRLTSAASATCQDDHGYSAKSRKPVLLTLDVPPKLSTCSHAAAKRLRRRTTQNSFPTAKPKPTVSSAATTHDLVDDIVCESSSTSGSVSTCIFYIMF